MARRSPPAPGDVRRRAEKYRWYLLGIPGAHFADGRRYVVAASGLDVTGKVALRL